MHKRKLLNHWLSSIAPIKTWAFAKICLCLCRITLTSVSKRISPSGVLVGFDVRDQYIQFHASEPFFSGINHEGAAIVSASMAATDKLEDESGLVFRFDPFMIKLKKSIDDPELQEALRLEYGYYSPMHHPVSGEVIGVQLGSTNYPFPKAC